MEIPLLLLPDNPSRPESETQQWLSQSVAGNRSSADQASAAAKESPERLGTVLDLLVATSIQSRALVSYDWTLTFRPDRRH